MIGTELSTKAKIIVLFANAYDMVDDRGRAMTGCSVHYLFYGEDGEAFATQVEFDRDKPVGVQRAKCSADIGLRSKLVAAPALYEGTFVTTVGGDGKPVLKLQDVAYISHLKLQPHVLGGFVVPGMITPEPSEDKKGVK